MIQGIEQCMACMHVLETVVSCSPLHFWKKKVTEKYTRCIDILCEPAVY